MREPSLSAAGEKVGDLELPRWATDAQDFVQKLAEALESPLVSAKLHRWIDLIFGYRSRGRKAEEANNVFHYLTYDDLCATHDMNASRQMRPTAAELCRRSELPESSPDADCLGIALAEL